MRGVHAQTTARAGQETAAQRDATDFPPETDQRMMSQKRLPPMRCSKARLENGGGWCMCVSVTVNRSQGPANLSDFPGHFFVFWRPHGIWFSRAFQIKGYGCEMCRMLVPDV